MMLTKSSAGIVLAVLVILCQVSSAATFQFDEKRTGNFTYSGPDERYILWKASLTGLVGSSPVVWDGKVYVSNWYGRGSWNPGLYSIDAETGEIVWVNGNITGASTPAVYGGTVFIGSLAGKLYAVNATTGQIIWEKQLEMNPEWWGIASSPLVYNGTLYITTFSDGRLHALDLNGNELWNITTGKRISQYSSPSAYGGTIFFAGNSSSNMLYAVDEGGNVIWTFSTDGRILNTPSADYDMVFFATEKKLYGLRLDGNVAWSVPFNGTISSPALAYGRVYIGSADGKLYCFNASTGEKLWEFSANGRIYSSPAVGGEIVYFATNVPNGTIYAVDASSGSLLWLHSLSPPEGSYYNIMSSPFIYDGKLFIGSDDGNLYAFSSDPSLWRGNVELSTGRITVTLKDGSTAEINGRSALAALWKASKAGNFSVEIVNSSWGIYVESIAGIKPEGLNGWMYWVNYPQEPMPGVGAGDYILDNGDSLVFYYGSYNPETWEPSKPDQSDIIVVINVTLSNILWEGEVILEPGSMNITFDDGGTTSVNNLSALAALWKASRIGDFSLRIINTSWGPYIESVGDVAPNTTHYWLYWVNYPAYPSPSVGAGDFILKDGDELIFYFGHYNSTTWEPSSPEKSPYVVKIHVSVKGGAKITGLNISNGSRGLHATGYVDVRAMIDDWYAVVVSGTNENGDSIAGVSVIRLSAGDEVSVPVVIPIPQQAQTGIYRLYAGIYRLEDYPENVIDIYGSASCEVR